MYRLILVSDISLVLGYTVYAFVITCGIIVHMKQLETLIWMNRLIDSTFDTILIQTNGNSQFAWTVIPLAEIYTRHEYIFLATLV